MSQKRTYWVEFMVDGGGTFRVVSDGTGEGTFVKETTNQGHINIVENVLQLQGDMVKFPELDRSLPIGYDVVGIVAAVKYFWPGSRSQVIGFSRGMRQEYLRVTGLDMSAPGEIY